MTRFVVDAGAVLYLASEGIEVSSDHELLAPTLVRSQTLSVLHEAVHRGELPADVARERLERVWRMPIRLLGDAVLRRRAWEAAEGMGWAETYTAEYIALTQLQADASSPLTRNWRAALKGSSRSRRSIRCANEGTPGGDVPWGGLLSREHRWRGSPRMRSPGSRGAPSS
jgi:hypothetical protein